MSLILGILLGYLAIGVIYTAFLIRRTNKRVRLGDEVTNAKNARGVLVTPEGFIISVLVWPMFLYVQLFVAPRPPPKVRSGWEWEERTPDE